MLDATEVAERLGVSRTTVYRWARDRRLPYARLSPQMLRFKPEDLDAFLEDRLVTGDA